MNPPGRAGGGASQGERAYQELRRRILGNELVPGTQLLEQELAQMLGMSRTPVREAVIRLARDGIVEVRPRHGIRVLPVSARDMREIYDILTELEATAARLLAEHGADEETMAELEGAVDEMAVALERADLSAWAAADDRFHKALVRRCGNRRLREVVERFHDQAHRARLLTLHLRPRPDDSAAEHAAVVAAIRRRDPQTAHRVHREHRLRSGAMLVELLATQGPDHW